MDRTDSDQQSWVFFLVALGLALVGGGGFFFLSAREKVVVEIIPAEERGLVIMVDVGGAVEAPGIYGLEYGARLNEALVAAGGLAEKADRDWVEKNLNLAARLVDGEKIYIPQTGQYETTVLGQSEEGAINLNTSSASVLEDLPGIGPVRAQEIIEARPIITWDQLEDVLSAKIVSQIRPLATL